MPLLIFLILNVIASYLVFKDAAARDMNAIAWALFILLSSMLGLPFYLIARRSKNAG